MRFSFRRNHVRHFVRMLQSLARIAEEIRLISSVNSIRFEAVKSPVVCADITVNRQFFEQYSEEEPIDVYFTSRSILLIFRKAHILAKNLIRFDVTIQRDSDYAIFRQSMKQYDRVCQIPFTTAAQITELDFGDYESNPVRLISVVKMLTTGLRHFPGTIQLVTFRIRDQNVKVETGDEEAIAEYMTRFYFFKEEFADFKRDADVTVTFSLKYLKQFLSVWDKNHQDVVCHFKQDSSIMFTTTCTGFKTRFLLSAVVKEHPPNSPVPTGDETLQSTNVTTVASHNMSHVNQSLTNYSMDQTAGDQQSVPNDEMEDEFEDDGLDAIVSACPIPAAAAANQTSVMDTTADREADDSFSAAVSMHPLTNVTPGHQSTQNSHSFDPRLYRELLDNTGYIRDGRKIVMLDTSVTNRSITTQRDIYSDDDESDEEVIFTD